MNKDLLVSTIRKQDELWLQRLEKFPIPRLLDLRGELKAQEISVITGVRRCGKSQCLAQLKKLTRDNFRVLHIEFDDPALESFAGEDLPQLVEVCSEISGRSDGKKLLLLDEIQNIKGWERWLTQIAKDPELKIVVTGSNAKLLSSELGTFLTGRHIAHEMTPLSYAEILSFEKHKTKPSSSQGVIHDTTYRRFYTFGGFPRSYSEEDASILPQYFTDILERDVIARHGIRLKRPLRELARVLCSDNTRLLNRSTLTRQLGVKDDGTLKRYSHWLEECYLFYEVKGFDPSVRRQMRSQPKFYCVDPAMARYSSFRIMGDEGSFLENMVFLELRRRGYEIHYWKASSGKSEVDFIVRKGGTNPLAIQASLTVIDESTLSREIDGLTEIHKELGVTDLLLITKADAAREFRRDGVTIQIHPFGEWASA